MTGAEPSEAPVTFAAGDRTLPGILHRPQGRGSLRGTGVIVLPGGLVGRGGLHRLYTVAARRLAALGAWVLRFDPPGAGEGPEDERAVTADGLASLDAPYEAEVGAALDLVGAYGGVRWMALLGHCTGARSAIVRAAVDPRVRAVIAWSMPFGSDGGHRCPVWLDHAMRCLVERRVPALWVYGTRAPAYAEFTAFVATCPTAEAPRVSGTWAVREIGSANHDFTSVAWTREAIAVSAEWLAARNL